MRVSPVPFPLVPPTGTAIALILALTSTARAESPPPAAADEAVAEVVVSDRQDQPEGSAESGYRNSTGNVGPLGRQALKDTPYSLNVTSGQLIENTNAHSLGEALKTNPTATVPTSHPRSAIRTRQHISP